MESDVITLQDLFDVQARVDRGRPHDHRRLRPTGLRPMFLHKFEKHGIELPASLFAAAPPQLSEIARGRR